MDIADYKLTSPKGLLLDRWGRGFLKITRKRRAEWTWLPSQILLVAAEILQHVSASSMWFLETKAKDTSPLGVVPTKGGSLSPQVLLRLREPMGNRRYSSPSACFMCLWSDCIFERKKKPFFFFPKTPLQIWWTTVCSPTCWSWVCAASRGHFWPPEQILVRTEHRTPKASTPIRTTLSGHLHRW